MLGDGLCGDWDSSLEADQSLEQLDRTELQPIVDQFIA
jgi:hypothetical protein